MTRRLEGKTVRGDTWGWDGAAWTLIAPEKQNDPDTPTPRYAATMAYYLEPGGADRILLFVHDDEHEQYGEHVAAGELAGRLGIPVERHAVAATEA